MSRRGDERGTYAILLDPETWRGIDLQQSGLLALEIWQAMLFFASRR